MDARQARESEFNAHDGRVRERVPRVRCARSAGSVQYGGRLSRGLAWHAYRNRSTLFATSDARAQRGFIEQQLEALDRALLALG
jgi:hypothetical protein